MNWENISSLNQLNQVLINTQQKDSECALFFKHSPRCGISSMVLRRFESAWDISNVNVFMVNVLSQRDASNELAQQFRIRHESPQILLIKNGKLLYTASHGDISAVDIKALLTN